ncbi:MAG: histidine kinase [Bacteroidaceae bacterium]|nr:histidine kinase [Bacteroidaceae bacterium]
MRRINWMKQSRQENLIYLVVWSLLFAAPLLSLYVRTVSEAGRVFDWMEVFIVWRKFAVFLLLFLVHNFLLAPLLVHGHKRAVYFSIVAVIIAAFTLYQCSNQPERHDRRPPHEMARHEFRDFHGRPDFPERREPPRPPKGHRPPLHVAEHDIMAVVLLMLMFGANLGIKGYLRSRDDRKRLAELEHENLEQQLEYLRYQINPHFFMNTLNNIHALVDIDPEQAKSTIVELSKMMRFVLYEGNKQGVPLTREFDFIRHYVTLMQLRYTDKVRITLDLPTEAPDSQIPPLILITFIENAFKHGVSYQRDSFIEVKVELQDNRLHFTCRNSKAEKSNEEKGGVGLDNVRKRLDLLYAHNYELSINDAQDIYTVELVLPFITS